MADDSANSRREVSRRDLFKMMAPKAGLLAGTLVLLDVDKCSACTLCARDCPSGAIAASGESVMQLSFRSSMCDGCGICVQVCPEKCLQLRQPAPVDTEKSLVLFQDEFALCDECGAVIGSKAMIRRVRSKLTAGDASLSTRIQLCPVCKAKSW